MFIGIDIGNSNVKTSKGVKFLSRVKSGHKMFIGADMYNVTIEGKEYIVGAADGYVKTDIDKIYDDDYYKVLFLTAIANSFKRPKIDCKVVAGVPVVNYSQYKDIYIEKILSYSGSTINVNGKDYTINISDCNVIPQSYVIFIDPEKFSDKSILVVDIGAGTIDVSYWEDNQPVNFVSYPKATYEIYNTLANKINSTHNLRLTMLDMEKMFNKDTIKDRHGNTIDISVYKDTIINEFAQEILNELNRSFRPELADYIYLIGGGANIFKDYFIKEYGKDYVVVDETPQFTNANAFEIAAKAFFGGDK